MSVKREHQQSELGEIPQDWDVVKLAKVCFVRKNRKVTVPNRIAVIPMEQVPTDSIYTQYLIKKKEEVKSGVYCKTGDILLAKITPSVENGKQGIVPEIPSNIAFATTEVFPIVCKEQIDTYFLFYMLKHSLIRNILASRMTGSTGRQRVPQSVVERLKIPLPPLVEQRGIVEVLSTVDECIRCTDAVIEKTEELKRGLMQQLLVKGIGHTEYKETPIGKIPTNWTIVNLRNISKQITKGTTPTTYGFSYVDAGVNFVKVENIDKNGRIDEKNTVHITEQTNKSLERSQLEENDILFSIAGALGRSAIVKKEILPANTNQALAIIRIRDMEYVQYVKYFLDSYYIQNEIERIKVQSAQANLSLGQIGDFKIAMPPKDEMRSIVDIIKNIDQIMETERKKQQYVKMLKQGLMQVLFLGKVRVELGEDGLHRIGNN